LRISIFTATHDSKYLNEVYASIKDQDFFEWVIIYNHGAKKTEFNDNRVKGFVLDMDGGIGFYKMIACGNCSGDILLELDHDDLLCPTAIEEVKKAFGHQGVGFVYSNSLITDMKFGKRERFLASHGWE
jgi:glycosyltransferase involved in cell wall biosynthesis